MTQSSLFAYVVRPKSEFCKKKKVVPAVQIFILLEMIMLYQIVGASNGFSQILMTTIIKLFIEFCDLPQTLHLRKFN